MKARLPITIVLVALLVSACAGLRPDRDPMTFAGSPEASVTAPGLDEGVSFSVNLDAALRQAQDLRRRGEIDPASRLLGQLVIAAPNNARVIGEYGKVMLESGRTDDAVAFLERAVALNQTDWTLFSALGVAYDQTGRAEAARAAFNHALALEPGEPVVLSNLALSHVQLGELDEAERLLDQASAQDKDVPGLADKLAMVRSLKGTIRQSVVQTRQPDASPPMLPPAVLEPPQNTEDDAPAMADDPDSETVTLVRPPSVIATEPDPIKSAAPAPQVQQGIATIAPNAVRPPPKAVSIPSPAARPMLPRPLASRASPALPSVAAAKRTEPVVSPRSRPVEAPRPAGVARAVTRAATIPLVATAPAEPWESMMRVSLPPPSAALEKSSAAVVAAPAAASETAEQPSGWGGILERWRSAVLGFIGELWLRAFPERDAEVA
jgi:hypothetical protein